MSKLLSFLLLSLLCFPAFCQDGWRDEHGHPARDTDSRRSVNGFGGSLVVTPDADWQAKWQTPSDTVPHFSVAKIVPRGQQVFFLIFFANPLLKEDGTADITCDIDVLRPDGKSSFHQLDVPCFKGAIHEPVTHTFLAPSVIGWTGDSSDSSGTWVLRVLLKDNVRKASVPLRTSFELK
ncbi:hypothetical protein [Dyella kyungheensis]|jgi:hypothetical protein|uniref:Uncharacterized protein n=1 Tax=Dyella kyungheensis TaxID=1242174 RepID=A0ABS2JMZ9_9GAMM|nr:hypothetical protein [Dyella kyungheensis]MBM7119959.1 hypothetical protein [Dyella kyungheensis]